MIRCSIVVPVFNHASLTKQCLDRLFSQRFRNSTEIIVVDDGSTDLTHRLLAGWARSVRVVRHQTNTGFATACNDGAMTADGEYVVFLNNDTLPSPGWLDALVAYVDRHPRAAVVGSKLLFPNDTIQHAGVVFQEDGWPLHLYYGFPAHHSAVDRSRRFQAVTGACMLVRRDVFEQLGGFDTAYMNVYEDVDFCLRAGELGHEVHYCHQSVIHHLESLTRHPTETCGQMSRDDHHSQRLYARRWKPRVERDAIRYLMEDGLVRTACSARSALQVSVAPEVAVVNGHDGASRADRILAERARQVGDLLEENIRLKARLQAIEFATVAAEIDKGAAEPFPWPGLRANVTALDVRRCVARLYIEGHGLEIGALHAPVEVRPPSTVRYIDRMCVADLRRQYPELNDLPLVEADIIDDGEKLQTIGDGTQDFVISSHFLEHCEDPILAVKTMLRVLRPGGIVYVAVPDKRFTFDRHRPVTPFEHLVRDHTQGPAWSRQGHFEEWASLGEDVNTRTKTARDLMEMNYSIHFHVWTQAGLLALFARLQDELRLGFDVEAVVRNGIEVIFILRKD
jgi:GT2 family glycosyltransferase/SAM-dependent methyltransferase